MAAVLRPVRIVAPWLGALSLVLTSPVLAKPPINAASGGGTRYVEVPPSAPPGPAPAQAGGGSKKSHKQGHPPKAPAARLPKGTTKQEQDLDARRAVAGGATREESQKKLNDPELQALRDAERILFPRPLTGFQSGWSWSDADPSVQEQGLPPIVQALPSAARDDAVLAEWLRSLSMPDFPVRLDARVVSYLKFYRDTKRGRAITRTWAQKIGRYTAAMQAELSKAGLPKDLVWMSLVESGHNPTAMSPAGAAGMWQFIPESGRMYGLTVDRWVDERLDPERATQAAARYLGDLYQRFGTWELAMAAYNMGHGGLLRSVRKYNTNDFWRLSRYEAGLPWETSLYVPKVVALALVMNNKRAFGIEDVAPDAAISFDTVYVESAVSLDDVAAASGVPLESLRSMNPQYLTGRAPPAAESSQEEPTAKTWPIKVPKGAGTKTASALSRHKHGGRHRPTLVRFGDTLETMATRFQVSETALRALNGVRPNETLIPGSVLLLPSDAKPAADDTEPVVVVPSDAPVPFGRKRIFYRVLSGDTLDSVAHALAVSAAELVTWNALDASAALQSGMTLQVFVPADHDLSAVRHVTSASKVVEVGSEPFVDYFEGLNGRRRITVIAKSGESLSSIGRRYGLSIGMMERINRFSRSKQLRAGERIIVYVKDAQASEGHTQGKPLAQIEAPRPDALPEMR